MILYKRNAQGKPIFWSIYTDDKNITVKHGLVGKEGTKEIINTHRKIKDEIDSLIKAKRKTGYKELKDLYDNAPDNLIGDSLISYLNTYLPKDNTHENGKFIPMLCKTLDDNKPFEKHNYFGQWKINGERCIITANKSDDLFGDIKLNYRSREGVDWTDKLAYLDEHLLPCIKGDVLDMMIEEGVALDGELYIPGYDINHINSFISKKLIRLSIYIKIHLFLS
jgi:predicted DNA-binding WGR domain protein